MGLVVHFLKSSGSGTSNDGSRLSQSINKKKTGEILDLLFRFYIIFVSSGNKINCLKFKDYCFYTVRLYVSLYPWYYMAQSVHKVLIHGHDIIQ